MKHQNSQGVISNTLKLSVVCCWTNSCLQLSAALQCSMWCPGPNAPSSHSLYIYRVSKKRAILLLLQNSVLWLLQLFKTIWILAGHFSVSCNLAENSKLRQHAANPNISCISLFSHIYCQKLQLGSLPGSFVKYFFQDIPTNFYRSWFIFDQHGTKNMLAFFETRCICVMLACLLSFLVVFFYFS